MSFVPYIYKELFIYLHIVDYCTVLSFWQNCLQYHTNNFQKSYTVVAHHSPYFSLCFWITLQWKMHKLYYKQLVYKLTVLFQNLIQTSLKYQITARKKLSIFYIVRSCWWEHSEISALKNPLLNTTLCVVIGIYIQELQIIRILYSI